MPFDWRFRNFKRDPQPFLNGAVIDAENARNNLVQNAGNDMEGYTPLESTLAAQAMEGYKPVVPATQSQLAAGASQAMQGYTPNSAGRPSVPNDMHGGMGQPDLEGYGESLQAASDAAAQAQAKEQQIADIESQIVTLQKRIDDNKAKLQKWVGNADQIAAIEARKINSQDPTMIWRWKAQMDENRRIANAQNGGSNDTAKVNAAYEIQNDLDSIIVDDKMDSATQKTYLSKLANLKTLAQKNGLKTDSIDAKIKEVKGETETTGKKSGPEGTEYEGTSREQWDNEAEELLGKPNLTQGDIMKFKQKNPNISNEVRQKLEAKHSQLIESDKKKTYEKKWNSYLADYEKKNGKVSDRVKQTLRRIYDKKNKKG